MVMINDVTRTVTRLRSGAAGLRNRLGRRADATVAVHQAASVVPQPRSEMAGVDFSQRRVAGRAIGTVADLIALGSSDGHATEYLVVLEVQHPAEATTWPAVHHQLLTPEDMDRWQPGCRLPVLFDPFDREQVLVG